MTQHKFESTQPWVIGQHIPQHAEAAEYSAANITPIPWLIVPITAPTL